MTFRLGDVATLPAPLRADLRRCSTKLHHPTAARALAQIETLYANGKAEPGSLNFYRCPLCDGGWLVGHRKVRTEHSQ